MTNDLLTYFENNKKRLIFKWMHYFEIYDRYFSRFRGTDVHFLEIGIFQGGSLQMWKDYFGPKARIFGVDHNPRCQQFEEDQVTIFIGDQADKNFLSRLKREMPRLDIVVDDGGHTMEQQINTFEALYPHISANGIYLYEDILTSYWKKYGGGCRNPGSFVEYSKNFVDALHAWHFEDADGKDVSEFTKSTYGLHFYDGILVIEKRPISRPFTRETGQRTLPAADASRAEMPETSRALWSQPNKFARPPGIEVRPGRVTIHGYQEFRISPEKIEPLRIDQPLRIKRKLVQSIFNPDYLTGKTVLDIGANGGFFSLWACHNGARQVVSLDMDEAYLDLIRQAQTAFGWQNIRTIHARVQDWDEPADLVLAFAMVHWLYSCTANYGSLEAVVEKLAGLSRSLVLIEWVAPEDPAIRSFKHSEWNPRVAKDGYNLEAFESALRKWFCKVEMIGPTSPTRTLYMGCRRRHEVTLHPALPLLAPADRVISSRCLAEYKKRKYYSRVYSDASPDRIVKQATADMALHEAKILERLQGAYFPRVISSEQCDGYSVFVMERIVGVELAESRAEISSNPKYLAGFLGECLAILSQMRAAGIRHRDIRLENVLVRDGHPALIDFGWAETGDEAWLNPGGLGGLERIQEGPPCDAYSMGRVFEQIIPENSKLFAPLLEMMLNPELARSVAITELQRVLKSLELPEAWDVPLVFSIPRQAAARPGAEPIKTGVLSAEAARFWKRCRKILRS